MVPIRFTTNGSVVSAAVKIEPPRKVEARLAEVKANSTRLGVKVPHACGVCGVIDLDLQ